MDVIELEIDGIKNEYVVKSGWGEATIKNWREMYQIDEKWSDIRKRCASVAIMLTDDIGNTDLFMKMKPSDFSEIESHFTWVGSTKIETKETVNDFIEVDSEKYYCLNDFNSIQNLEIEALEMISAGRSDNFLMYYNLLCTVFFRKKIDGKFEEFHEDFLKTRADIFDRVLISDIMSLFFFSTSSLKT